MTGYFRTLSFSWDTIRKMSKKKKKFKQIEYCQKNKKKKGSPD